jgi:LAGLIDADG endonuclease
MIMVANMKNNLSIIPLVYKLYNRKVPADMNKNQFSNWLSGFIDLLLPSLLRFPLSRMTSGPKGGQRLSYEQQGEGNFQVFLDRNYLRAVFRIRLHIDDIAILFKIKEFLGVGKVSIHGSNCLFSVTNIRDIQNVFLPLLDNYNLFTIKWLDYLDFKLVVTYLSSANTTKVSNEKLE